MLLVILSKEEKIRLARNTDGKSLFPPICTTFNSRFDLALEGREKPALGNWQKEEKNWSNRTINSHIEDWCTGGLDLYKAGRQKLGYTRLGLLGTFRNASIRSFYAIGVN